MTMADEEEEVKVLFHFLIMHLKIICSFIILWKTDANFSLFSDP